MGRIVCQNCQTVLEEGDPVKGTKFMTCTPCMRDKLGGTDPNILRGVNGQRLSGPNKTLPETSTEVKLGIDSEYVMEKGKIWMDFNLSLNGVKFRGFCLTEEEMRTHLEMMVDIREKAEAQKKLRDNLEGEEPWPTSDYKDSPDPYKEI